MTFSSITALLAIPLLFASANVLGQSDDGKLRTALSRPDSSGEAQNSPVEETAPPPISPSAPRMETKMRYQMIHDFDMQLVYARTAFPMGTKGLLLKGGVVTPHGKELQQMLNLWGPAVKPGDPARISFLQIKNDHIHLEINGGPILRKKWYQKVQISGANGPVTQTDAPQDNPHGSFVDIYFDKYVPEMTAAQFRELLFPVLDFHARNKEQAYLDTVPPKAKACNRGPSRTCRDEPGDGSAC